MRRAVHRVRREIARGPPANLSNLSRFEVQSEKDRVPAIDFVASQREIHRVEISESDEGDVEEKRSDSLSPGTFRAVGQAGLEQFVEDPTDLQ